MEEEKIDGAQESGIYKIISGLMGTVFTTMESVCFLALIFYHFSQNPADCGQMQPELDLTISADTRKEAACKPEIAYGKFKSLNIQFH